jgi:hypothetical protein
MQSHFSQRQLIVRIVLLAFLITAAVLASSPSFRDCHRPSVVGRQVICPLSSLISDFPKNILVPTHPKSLLELSHPTPPEGRIAIVTDAGWGAVDAAAFCARRDCRAGWRKARERSTACGREMLAAYGEVVWS